MVPIVQRGGSGGGCCAKLAGDILGVVSTAQAQPASSRTIVLLDAQGRVTTDKSRAVGGEILSTDEAGVTTSTLFDIDAGDTVSAP